MSWKSRIAACFVDVDGKIDFNPSDEKDAKDLILEAKIAGASFEELEREMVWHLYKKGASRDDMLEHIDLARRYWSR